MTHPSTGGGGTTGPGRSTPAVGSTNGSYQYRAQQADETLADRSHRERFWRSLGKRIRAGARIR
ncbi:hypothetical protein AB0K20_23160 [Micromonospora matsumotoense]|uniref:hypothetical protein n=1 Tax=Micromonospora matsumotoense TaxID=121616 RepID=UPI00341851A9